MESITFKGRLPLFLCQGGDIGPSSWVRQSLTAQLYYSAVRLTLKTGADLKMMFHHKNKFGESI